MTGPNLPERKSPTKDDRCGTHAGRKAHQARGERSCDECKSFRNAEAATQRQAKGLVRYPPTDDERCGTDAGAQAHCGRREHPCDACREAKRITRIFYQYGITPEALINLLAQFDGLCWVPDCQQEATKIDHDHDCCPGKQSCGRCVRGILCHECNIVEGSLKHRPEIYRIAFGEYLARTPLAQKIIEA